MTATEAYSLVRAEKDRRTRRGECPDLTPEDLDRLGLPAVECARTRERLSRHQRGPRDGHERWTNLLR